MRLSFIFWIVIFRATRVLFYSLIYEYAVRLSGSGSFRVGHESPSPAQLPENTQPDILNL